MDSNSTLFILAESYDLNCLHELYRNVTYLDFDEKRCYEPLVYPFVYFCDSLNRKFNARNTRLFFGAKVRVNNE